jgi:hypothetical protein
MLRDCSCPVFDKFAALLQQREARGVDAIASQSSCGVRL